MEAGTRTISEPGGSSISVLKYHKESADNHFNSNPTCSNEAEDLVQIDYLHLLPPEMWMLVFEKLDDVKDLWHCFHTNKVWSDLLFTQLPDLHIHLALPFLLPYMSKTDLLRVSQVSRVWIRAVDCSIQTAEKFGSEKRLRKNQQIKLNFSLASQLTSFKNQVTATMARNKGGAPIPSNPVVFRRVIFHFQPEYNLKEILHRRVLDTDFRSPQEEYNACREYNNCEGIIDTTFIHYSLEMNDFLETHGHLIHYSRIRIWGHNLQFLWIIQTIHNCLVHMPQLRVLNVRVHTRGNDLTENDLTPVNSFLALNPWPKLGRMNVLKSRTDKPQLINLILNAYGDQLKHCTFKQKVNFEQFQISYDRNRINNMPVRCDTRLSSLQSLSLKLKEREMVEHFLALVRSRHPLPVKTLVVLSGVLVSLHGNTLDELISGVKLLDGTLQNLTLSHQREFSRTYIIIDKWTRLCLSHLKTLRLIFFGFPSIQFLKAVCPAVEFLYVKESGHNEMESQENGKMYRNLYTEQEFWQMLPNLKTVHVSYRFLVYSRGFLAPGEPNPFEHRHVFLKYYRHIFNHPNSQRQLNVDE